MALNVTVINLIGLIGSSLIVFPLIWSEPGIVFLVLSVVINCLILLIVVLRIALRCLSPLKKSFIAIGSDIVLLGGKI